MFAGAISGPGSLTQTGGGTLTQREQYLHRRHNVGAGVLCAGAANALSPYSNVAVNGGTLDVGAAPQTIHSLAMSSGALNLSDGDLLSTGTGAASFAGTLDALNFTSGNAELISYGCGRRRPASAT